MYYCSFVPAGPQDLIQGMNSLSVVDHVKAGDPNAISPLHLHQPHVNFQNLATQPVPPNVGSMVPAQFQMYPNHQYNPGMLQAGMYSNNPQVPVGNRGMMMNVQGVGYSDMYHQVEGLSIDVSL